MATPQIMIETAAGSVPAPDTGPRNQAVLDLRQAVLQELDGLRYRPLARIPHEWPVIRAFVLGTVRALLDEGLVQASAVPGRDGGAMGYRMTAAGRKELQRLRAAADRTGK